MQTTAAGPPTGFNDQTGFTANFGAGQGGYHAHQSSTRTYTHGSNQGAAGFVGGAHGHSAGFAGHAGGNLPIISGGAAGLGGQLVFGEGQVRRSVVLDGGIAGAGGFATVGTGMAGFGGVRKSAIIEGGPIHLDGYSGRRSVIVDGGFGYGAHGAYGAYGAYGYHHPGYYYQMPQMVRPIYALFPTGQQKQETVVTETVSEEVQTQLRLKTEECEQWRLKCQQLESQLRAMEDKLRRGAGDVDLIRSQYEAKISEYMNEIERLNGVLRVKLEEIERLRGFQTKCIEFEGQLVSYTNEIDALRMELDRANLQKKQKADEAEEYRRKLMRLESEFNEINMEISRLNDELNYKNRENGELKNKLSKLEITIRELREREALIIEYENKIALLSQEVERLNSLLKRKGDEINNLNSTISSLEAELNSKEYEISDYKAKISKLEITIRDLKAKCEQIIALENQVAMLSQEIERLNSMLRGKTSELDNFKRSSTTFQTTIEEREIELGNLRGDLNAKARQYDELNMKYTTIVSELRSKDATIQEYENRIALLSQEVERLNSMMKTRANEIEEWKMKYSRLESESAQFGRDKLYEYETKISTLTSEIESLTLQLSEFATFKTKYNSVLLHVVLLCAEIDALRINDEAKRKEVANVQKEMKEERRKSTMGSQLEVGSTSIGGSALGGERKSITTTTYTTTKRASNYMSGSNY